MSMTTLGHSQSEHLDFLDRRMSVGGTPGYPEGVDRQTALRVKLSNLSLNYGQRGSQQLISLGGSSFRSGSLDVGLEMPEDEVEEESLPRVRGRGTSVEGRPVHTGLTRSTGLDSLMAAFGESETKHTLPQLPHRGKLLSIFYGLSLIILAVALPIGEALQHEWLSDILIAIYLVYLYGVAIIVILTMELYIACVKRRRKKKNLRKEPSTTTHGTDARPTSISAGVINLGFEDEKRNSADWGSHRSGHGAGENLEASDDFGLVSRPPIMAESQRVSLYLRIVIVVFGLAGMVYDGLLVRQLHEADTFCEQTTIIWPQYVYMVFLLLQTYFLFKHPQVSGLSGKALFRIGFVHIMACNICVLWRTLVRQVMNVHVKEMDILLDNNGTTASGCNQSDGLLSQAAHYLYPCLIEYSILAVAVFFLLFTSLDEYPVPSAEPVREAGHTDVNCQRTHRGLFCGVVVLAGTFVSVILYFAYGEVDQQAPTIGATATTPLLIYQISDLALHGVLLVTTLVAWIQIGRLSFFQPIELAVDDGILLISMATGVLFHVLKLMPSATALVRGQAADAQLVLSLACSLVSIATLMSQTGFMLDLSCRYLSLDTEWEAKPGRAAVTLLLLTNVSLWFLKSFQINVADIQEGFQGQTYGSISWQIMVFTLVPLLIFYYIFSSAFLAKLWQKLFTRPRRRTASLEPPAHALSSSTPAKGLEHVRQRQRRQRAVDSVRVNHMWSPVSDV